MIRQAKALTGTVYDDLELPLTLGRDFTGVVVSKGHGVKRLQLGDEVWGVVPIEQQGCHAHYVTVNDSLVRRVSFSEHQRVEKGTLIYIIYCETSISVAR